MKKTFMPFIFAFSVISAYSLGSVVSSYALENKHQEEIEKTISKTKIQDYELYSQGKKQKIGTYPSFLHDSKTKEVKQRLIILLSNTLDIPKKDVEKKLDQKQKNGHYIPYATIAEKVEYKKIKELKTLLKGDKEAAAYISFNIDE